MNLLEYTSNQITLNVYKILNKKIIVPQFRILEVLNSVRTRDQISPMPKILEIVVDLITDVVVEYFSEKQIFQQNIINLHRNILKSSGLDNVEITKLQNRKNKII